MAFARLYQAHRSRYYPLRSMMVLRLNFSPKKPRTVRLRPSPQQFKFKKIYRYYQTSHLLKIQDYQYNGDIMHPL